MLTGTTNNSIKTEASFSSIFSASCSSYDSFHHYDVVETLIDAHPANHVVQAKSKITGDSCFLCLRHGEYSAQLDKAISDINRKFIPSTPLTWIVQKANNFYIASKTIENIMDIDDIVDELGFTPYHFGRISVLSHFLGEYDRHLGNVIISRQSENILTGDKIDNAEALHDACLLNAQLVSEQSEDEGDSLEPDFSVPELDLTDFNTKAIPEPFSKEDVFANHWNFPPAIVNHFQYKKEQAQTLQMIASTPFSEFASILHNAVTASKRVEHLAFFEKLLEHNMIWNPTVREKMKAQLSHPETFPKVSEIGDSIKLLEKRHQRYCALNNK